MGFNVATPVVMTVANTSYPISIVSKLVKTLLIQPKQSNTGIMSIGDKTMPTVVVDDTGIALTLPAPVATSYPYFQLTEQDAPNGIDLGNFRIASTVGGDIARISYNEQ